MHLFCLSWTPSRSTLANIETAVEFALRPLAMYLRSYLKTDDCVGCDDTGVLLITPQAMPDLSGCSTSRSVAIAMDRMMC